ncbi:Alpha/Beta hydrolase protein [Aspergillus floccosus]
MYLTTALAALLYSTGVFCLEEPVVDLGHSQYRGNRLPSGIDEYLGVPYAAPPVGDLRFRAPRDPVGAPEVQDTTEFRRPCVGVGQNVSVEFAEDCLYMNVFTPSNATAQSKLPVWVHIQGGGYAWNSNANFNGSKVIQESGFDVVYVAFNYRVGALGFLASERVRQDGDLNVGLLDQRKALFWIKEHIQQFGGDPGHVVIHGDSAGAGSIAHHMTAYGGRDDRLFMGAVYESPFWPTLRTVSEMEFQFDRFVGDAGCSDAESPMECLRAADLDRLLKANVVSSFPGAEGLLLPYWYFLPVIDGDLIQDQLYTLFSQGKSLNMPLLVGDDTNEGTEFVNNASTPAEMASFLKANYPHLQPASLKAIQRAYPLMPPVPNHNAYFPSVAAAYGDATFTCPGNFITMSMAERNDSDSKVWNYRYNVRAPALMAAGVGVPHVFEMSAIFGVGYAGNEKTTSYNTVNKAVVPIVMDYWISFVKYLDPNVARNRNAPEWGRWGSGDGKRLKIETNATSMEPVSSMLTEHCALWKALGAEMEL